MGRLEITAKTGNPGGKGMSRKGILIYKIRLIRSMVRRIQSLKTSGRYKYEFKEIDILAEKLVDLEATILESKITALTGKDSGGKK